MKKKIAIILCCIALLSVIAGVIFAIIANQVAPVVTEFEKERAKEIALLKKEIGPGYIVEAGSRVGYVRFLFVVPRYAETGMEKFVKEHDLKKRFPEAKIETGYAIVTLEFKRNDYTKAVHDALTKLSKKHPVQSGSPHIYADSTIKYKPNISLYAKNPTKLEFERQDRHKDSWMALLRDAEGEGKFEVGRIITSKPAYDAFVDSFANRDLFKELPEELETIKAQYSEDFFESNALLVTREVAPAKTGYNSYVDNVYLSDKKIYVVVSRVKIEEYIIDDGHNGTFYLTVSKDAIKGATELITLD